MLDKEKSMANHYQDKRLDNIEKHIEIINREIGEFKLEVADMRTAFTEETGKIVAKIMEMKASRKEIIYAIIIPILMGLVGFLVALVDL